MMGRDLLGGRICLSPKTDHVQICKHWSWQVAMQVYFFRLSLKPVQSPDGLGLMDPITSAPYTREAWLRTVFAVERTFFHHGAEFKFIPAGHSLPTKRHLIVGWIARSVLVSERTEPSEGFEPTERPSWRGSLIVIDPSEHADGQKIAFEKRGDVGQPTPVLRSLARNMKIGDDPRPYDVQIFAIAEESSFWKFAESHAFEISSLTFEVAAPNMFGGADDFSNEMRLLRNRNNVSNVKTTLESDTKLDVKQDNIREIVNYTEKGAGSIKAKTTSNARYSSTKAGKHSSINADATDADFWTKLVNWLEESF